LTLFSHTTRGIGKEQEKEKEYVNTYLCLPVGATRK
jgi:hypothetical protein